MSQEQQQSQLKNLIAKGKVQGYLTYAEVNDHLPGDIVDPEQIEDIIGMINDMGISVHEVAPDEDTLITDAAVAADDDDVAEVAALASVDSEFGRTSDPVRMYMREMGSVGLLSRKDELKIAKRIEDGLRQVVKAVSRSGNVVTDFIAAFEAIGTENGPRLTDLMTDFVDLEEPEGLEAPAAVAGESDDKAEEPAGLDYEEAREKVEQLRKKLKTVNNCLKKYGYGHEKTEHAFDLLEECFLVFKWTPQYFKKIVAEFGKVIDEIRVQEKKILNICVRKAKMSRKDFINSFTENEASSGWLDQYLNGEHPCSDVLKEHKEEIRKAQKVLARI